MDASHLKKSWNVEENGGKQCWQQVGRNPDPGVVGQLQGPVDDWSVKKKCKDKTFYEYAHWVCCNFMKEETSFSFIIYLVSRTGSFIPYGHSSTTDIGMERYSTLNYSLNVHSTFTLCFQLDFCTYEKRL